MTDSQLKRTDKTLHYTSVELASRASLNNNKILLHICNIKVFKPGVKMHDLFTIYLRAKV